MLPRTVRVTGITLYLKQLLDLDMFELVARINLFDNEELK